MFCQNICYWSLIPFTKILIFSKHISHKREKYESSGNFTRGGFWIYRQTIERGHWWKIYQGKLNLQCFYQCNLHHRKLTNFRKRWMMWTICWKISFQKTKKSPMKLRKILRILSRNRPKRIRIGENWEWEANIIVSTFDQHEFLAPSGALGVTISVCLSVCPSVTVINCLEHSIFIFLAQIFKLFSQHSQHILSSFSALSQHTLISLSDISVFSQHSVSSLSRSYFIRQTEPKILRLVSIHLI